MQKASPNLSGATKEFSRFAHSYEAHNVIQAKVAKELVSMLPHQKIASLIDVGCGSGAIYRNLHDQGYCVDRFVALDASAQMLSVHPDAPAVSKVVMDFSHPTPLLLPKETVVISSSALQWSSDLDATFSWLSSIGQEGYFAIFTANTFRTLHQTAQITSPIYSASVLQSHIDRYYDATYSIRQYQLGFDSTQAMFRYIKQSGVSGGTQQLGYKAIKAVMERYPLDYLEFEVLFCEATRKNSRSIP